MFFYPPVGLDEGLLEFGVLLFLLGQRVSPPGVWTIAHLNDLYNIVLFIPNGMVNFKLGSIAAQSYNAEDVWPHFPQRLGIHIWQSPIRDSASLSMSVILPTSMMQ